MSINPDPSTPEFDKRLEYNQERPSESDSQPIEATITAYSVPPDWTESQELVRKDSLADENRSMEKAGPDEKVGLEAWKTTNKSEADSSEVRRLFQNWPELQKGSHSNELNEAIRIGRYRILKNISHSRMGRVFRGVDERTGALVALKFPPDVLSDQTLDRFRREIRITQKLRHPQIVTVVDELQYRGLPVFVMPWVDGIDLGRIVKAQGRLSESDTAAIGAKVARVLKYLAKSGVTHRDIKPSNLMLALSGEIKLIDLGLALWQNSDITDETVTESVQIIGTLDYIAPEQARDAHIADYRADIYSLGCTLCKLVTGRAPFENSGDRHALKKIMAHSLDPFPDLNEKYSHISVEFVDLLKQMCSKLPADRLTSHDLLIERLEKLATGSDLDYLFKKYADSGCKTEMTKGFTRVTIPTKYNLLKTSRRKVVTAGLLAAGGLGISNRTRLTATWNQLTELFRGPTDFLFADNPQKWLDPHTVFIMDGNLRSIHLIDPDKNFQVTGFTPPYSGSNLAITRSGKMFGATSQGRIRSVDLKTNSGNDYPNLLLDQDLNDQRGRGSGGMDFVNAQSLYVTGRNSGRLYKIDTTKMEFDRRFGENGFVTVGQMALGIDHDPDGNIYVACSTGVAKVSPDGKTVDRNFITGLKRATAVGGFSKIFKNDLFVADEKRVLRYSMMGKLVQPEYLEWDQMIDHLLVDRFLDLIYVSCYSYVDYINVYKLGVRGIPYRKITNVGLNLAQMTLPVAD